MELRGTLSEKHDIETTPASRGLTCQYFYVHLPRPTFLGTRVNRACIRLHRCLRTFARSVVAHSGILMIWKVRRTMRRPTAAIGSAVFFILAPGVVVGLIPWLLTGGWRVRPWDPAERDEPGVG